MIKKFLGFCCRFALYVFAFMMLVWVFLGISPTDSLNKVNNRIWQGYRFMFADTVVDDITKTAGSMKRAANRELNQASERIAGKEN